MKILQSLCSIPTAPFAEGFVVRFVEEFVKTRPKLRLRRDGVGNLLIEMRSQSRLPRWVFTAHMDHPGMVAGRMVEKGVLEADFRGWVQIDYVKGAKVRFFNSAAKGWEEVPGRVIETTADEYDKLTVPSKVRVRVSKPVAAGAPGMFDLGEGRVRGKRFYSRCCDDLAGAAGALAMLDELLRRPAKSPVAVLLTRAEEEGFIGAVAAVKRPVLLRKTDRVIAIETSAEQPHAPQGAGAIIRIGDKSSVFNSSLSYFMTHQAEALAKKDSTFRFQRALMPGGTCEATVYDIYGYMAVSICVALGNYHNMDRAKKRLGAEYVDISDWKNMVKLFVHLARMGHEYEPGHRLLKDRIEKRFKRLAPLLNR
ncbi:MAG: hypothetical protein IT447_03905 [Phycisphaerales bacterium]|jgi:endoglucanase|nr:hypothetical protein [Phycisphaerales bacterium]